MAQTQRLEILDSVRRCTYLECFECCSIHRMDYSNGAYMCEECYREVKPEEIKNPMETVRMNWRKFRDLVADSNHPKQRIKMLICKVFKMPFELTDIDKCYEDLMNNGQFKLL